MGKTKLVSPIVFLINWGGRTDVIKSLHVHKRKKQFSLNSLALQHACSNKSILNNIL